MVSILGRYELTLENGSVRIDLGKGHKVLCTYPGDGEYNNVRSIGIGTVGCDVDLPLSDHNLQCYWAEMSFGKTCGAAVAIADLRGGIGRAGSEGTGGKGEISLILILTPDFSISSMARGGITAVEAISATIQDLRLRDALGNAGSGSINLSMAVVSDPESELRLRGTGKHSKMGEIIGKTVYDAVRGSAEKNGIRINDSPISFLNSIGYTKERITKELGISEKRYSDIAERIEKDARLKAGFSALILLNDEIEWGLIPTEAGEKAGLRIIDTLCGSHADCGKRLMDSFVKTVFGS